MALFLIISLWYLVNFSEISLLLMVSVFFILYIYVDLLSGVLHIILDNENYLSSPLLKSLVEGFLSHHNSPSDIYTMSLFNHLYTMHLPLTLAFPFFALANNPLSYFCFLSIAVHLHLMQMCHRWAHLPINRLSPIVKTLQGMHIFLPKLTHAKHHGKLLDSNFCLYSGVFNPLLNFLTKKIGLHNPIWLISFPVLVLIIPLITVLLT